VISSDAQGLFVIVDSQLAILASSARSDPIDCILLRLVDEFILDRSLTISGILFLTCTTHLGKNASSKPALTSKDD
jgi:hypothetical protein